MDKKYEWKQQPKRKKQTVNDYTMKYGMICIDTPGTTPDEWRWLKGPMPWEGGDC